MTVGVRELKAHLSSYLRRVRAGATLLGAQRLLAETNAADE